MEMSREMQACLAIPAVRPFLSNMQLQTMREACRGEEGAFFQQKFIDLAALVSTMPKTYEQDGKGDESVVYLHYFLIGGDWYITEKDMDGGVQQAFGWTILDGDMRNAELGYISIRELVSHGAELDLHFEPRTLAQIKAERMRAHNPNPWVVVANPGTDDEDIIDDFPTHRAAVIYMQESQAEADIMKRLPDGTLTTEF